MDEILFNGNGQLLNTLTGIINYVAINLHNGSDNIYNCIKLTVFELLISINLLMDDKYIHNIYNNVKKNI